MSSLPLASVNEPLHEDDHLIFMSDDEETASDLSGSVDDDLLNLGSDDSDDDRSQSPILHATDDLEQAARDIVDLDGADHDNLDVPQHDDEEDEYSLEYSSDEMDDDNELDSEGTSDEEDLHQGVQDLAEALELSDEEGELEGSSDEDGPDLRAFRLFAPALERPSEDNQDQQISDSDFERIIAGWYFPTGSAHQGPRVGESYEARIASERLMQ